PRTSSALAIDPGYSRKSGGCAVALAFSGQLDSVFFERPSDFEGTQWSLTDVIVEQPQQDGRSWAVPPAVLIKLAWEGASLAGLYAGASGATLHTPTVNEWKASEKKPAHHARLWEVLSPAERAVLGGAKTYAVILAACRKG